MRNKCFLLLLLLSLFTLGCGDQTRDPALDQAWDTTVKIFDSIPASEQVGFLQTFRPSAESTAKKTFSGSELSERLAFIAELDAELRARRK
jgi:hypothetical protein